MSATQIRIASALALSTVAGLGTATVALRGDSAPSFSAVAILAGLIAVALFLVFDRILRSVYTRRLEWIQKASEELHTIARGEQDSLSTDPAPDERLEVLRERFSEVGDAIRRQREVLEQQKGTLSEILNGMGEGLLAIDESKRIVLANDRICELFGVSRPAPGRLFYEVLRHSSLVEAFDRGLAGENSRDRTTVSVGGQERQVEIRVVPAAGGSGIAAVALVIDVTQIEMLARMRRDFIADFSHEARTPLAGLRSSVETLQSGRLEEQQEKQLNRIVERQLGRLERLVSDLAELNSIESGETVLQKEPTELRQLLSDLAQDFFERAGDRKIAIIVDGAESTADVDPIRIEQVFSNLIDNAIRHAPESDEVRIELRDGDRFSEVRVSDRGPGIPREEREKVFHRFYRVDKSRSGDLAGTGLGLAITKHLVLQHGGSISVESEPGMGATFVVKLPRSG